ncbi:MAG: MFS transporter [Anaerolineales bacterium]|nr:MFS transporter [Anaerolineales bacterium]
MYPTSHQRALNLARAYYFFYFGGIGWLIPYSYLYFEKAGLNGSQIGFLAGLLPLGTLVVGPVWAAIGDRFHVHRWLLPIASFGLTLPVLVMPSFTSFTPLMVLMLLMAALAAPIGALADSATLDLLGANSQGYGLIRLGGTFGFAIMNVWAGWLVERAGLHWAFVGYAVCLALAGVVALGLPARRAKLQIDFNAGVRQLLVSGSFLFFLGGSFLIGLAFQASISFFPLRLQDLGASTFLIGIAGALSSVAEVPILVFARRIFQRLSPWAATIVAAVVYTVRWALVAVLTDPLSATLTQATHGLSFGMFLIGGVAYVDERSPAGLSATAQAIFGAIFGGIGAAAGAWLGGWLYQTYGATVLFGSMSGATLVALGLLLLARRFERL